MRGPTGARMPCGWRCVTRGSGGNFVISQMTTSGVIHPSGDLYECHGGLMGTMQACPSSVVFISRHAEDERLVESTLGRQQPPHFDKAGAFENPGQFIPQHRTIG